jgi:hypothetical protein
MATAKSKSARYYAANPEAKKQKAKTDTKINRRPEQIKKRVESNAKRREAKATGKDVRGKDYDHHTRSFVSIKTNRGRTGEGNRKKK